MKGSSDRATIGIPALDAMELPGRPCVATIGSFDGVHHGHRSLVRAAARDAARRGVELVAVTFSPRPEQVFAASALPDVCSVGERIRRLEAAGAQRVVVLPFSRALAAVDHRTFVRFLVERVGMRVAWVGADFALGRGRAGTPQRLRELGVETHVHALVPNVHGTAKASSSSVRTAIARGVDPAIALTEG